jgi:hypothetical protein
MTIIIIAAILFAPAALLSVLTIFISILIVLRIPNDNPKVPNKDHLR